MGLEQNFPMDNEKVYFVPGDLVTIKHDLPNKPVMLVKGKEQLLVRNNEDKSHFKGIRCFWFTTNRELQEGVFNTKDLEIYNG